MFQCSELDVIHGFYGWWKYREIYSINKSFDELFEIFVKCEMGIWKEDVLLLTDKN